MLHHITDSSTQQDSAESRRTMRRVPSQVTQKSQSCDLPDASDSMRLSAYVKKNSSVLATSLLTRVVPGIVCMLALAGCVSLSRLSETIPTREVSAAVSGKQRIVIVLPGYGDDLAMLEQANIAHAVQQAMPGTDVVLTEATFGYYMKGDLMRRLHDQIVEPARARGYREIWMAGASMGGIGVLMYEHEYPGALSGLVLMAPAMGSRSLLKEIEKAGGLASWDPGPSPSTINRQNVAREQWRVVKSLQSDPARAADTWLICGTEDRLRRASDMIATVLPANHSMRPVGGHRWDVWSPAAAELLRQNSD